MTDLVFEEPPPAMRGVRHRSAHTGHAAKLREHPGKWARIVTANSRAAADSLAYQIKTGRLRAYLPSGHYEAVARTVDSEHRVYARYVGEGGDPA